MYYKICRERKDGYFSEFIGNLEYKLGEWTRPVIPRSKLFVYNMPRGKLYSHDQVMFLVDIEGEPVVANKIMTPQVELEYRLEDWWAGNADDLSISCRPFHALHDISVILVDAVRLVKIVERGKCGMCGSTSATCIYCH